jgi:hypothetical protein
MQVILPEKGTIMPPSWSFFVPEISSKGHLKALHLRMPNGVKTKVSEDMVAQATYIAARHHIDNVIVHAQGAKTIYSWLDEKTYKVVA